MLHWYKYQNDWAGAGRFVMQIISCNDMPKRLLFSLNHLHDYHSYIWSWVQFTNVHRTLYAFSRLIVKCYDGSLHRWVQSGASGNILCSRLRCSFQPYLPASGNFSRCTCRDSCFAKVQEAAQSAISLVKSKCSFGKAHKQVHWWKKYFILHISILFKQN